MNKRSLPVVLATVLVSTLVVLSGGAVAATAAETASSTTTAGRQVCDVRSFREKLRNVKWTSVRGAIHRLNTENYVKGQTVQRSESIKLAKNGTWKAGATAAMSAEVGAEGTLKKIVGIHAKATGNVGFSTEFKSTESYSYTLRSKTTLKFTEDTRIAWFSGVKYVSGTYEYSKCDRIDGKDRFGGVVVWRSGRWSSFGVPESGGINCKAKPQGLIPKFAKAAGCS